jgi:zona occludens toxin (predicted ATPase)
VTTYAYVGRPGSGKSYSVVENQIMPALKAGRRVVTNIPLHLDKIREVEGCELAEVVEFPVDAVKLEPGRITEFVRPGDLFVLDEVSKIFPAGEKVKDVAPQYISLLTEHRHMVDAKGNACSIVLVVQDLGNIGLWCLRLVDFTYNHTKLSVVGASGSFRVDIYEGPVKGPNYPIKRRTRMLVGRYSKSVYSFYKSHTLSESALAGANEKSLDKRASILKRWGVLIGVPGGIIGIFMGIHFLGGAMDKARNPPGAKASRASVAPVVSAPSQLAIFSNGAQQFVERPPAYRIIGTVLNESDSNLSRVALLKDGEHRLVTVPYSKCRTVDERLECPVHGWFYSDDGIVGAKAQVAGGAAVTAWTLEKGAEPVDKSKLSNQAVAGSYAAQVEVLPPAHGDPVEGSEQLRVLAGNDAGMALRAVRSGALRAHGGS